MKFSWWLGLFALFLATYTCQGSTLGEKVKNFFGIFGNKPPDSADAPGPCFCSCGVRNEESRIVGGQTTRMNEFPWMARLSYLNKFYCGGTLINDRYVLTAAHCVKGFMWFMIKVTFGEHDRCVERGFETRYVVRVLTGDFSFLNFDNDIALLRLNERVPLSDTIRPICLPSVRGTHRQSILYYLTTKKPLDSRRDAGNDNTAIQEKPTDRTGPSTVLTVARKAMKPQNFLKCLVCGLLFTFAPKSIRCDEAGFSETSDDLRETRGVLDFLFGRFKTCGNCLCGRPNRVGEARFLGGEYTIPHEFPWLANIHVRSQLLLSGVLINDRYVLSSASQLLGATAPEIKVSLGEYDRCNLDVSSTTVSVESLILYPEYNPESHAHNLALIKLSQTIKFNRRISPICMPNPGSTYLGQVGTLVGWTVGNTEDRNKNQTCRPRKLGLPILGYNECIRSGINLMNFHNDSGCAGILGGSSIVCENDDGSSVQYRSYVGVYDLIGIISDVNKCDRSPAVSVFTRVGPHLNWILQQTKDACYCPK
ncbi:serine proteinase stubble-like [Ceratina calcarata]|uniref:Serine proteinase stubble-like n=1 Tax=Ceratina calcarata TaxID=156304 RepID=A0AAJ7SBR1_9HYME|nr:serine proteinase stubble-like [Ceratina calcarata]